MTAITRKCERFSVCPPQTWNSLQLTISLFNYRLSLAHNLVVYASGMSRLTFVYLTRGCTAKLWLYQPYTVDVFYVILYEKQKLNFVTYKKIQLMVQGIQNWNY